jgi:hypothetical protein
VHAGIELDPEPQRAAIRQGIQHTRLLLCVDHGVEIQASDLVQLLR